MKTFKYKIKSLGEEFDLCFLVTTYQSNGNMAIIMFDPNEDEEWGDLTVNLDFLAPGYAYIDTNNNSGAIDMIKKYSFAKHTGSVRNSGFNVYPLYEFNMDKIKDYLHPDSDYFLIKNEIDNGDTNISNELNDETPKDKLIIFLKNEYVRSAFELDSNYTIENHLDDINERFDGFIDYYDITSDYDLENYTDEIINWFSDPFYYEGTAIEELSVDTLHEYGVLVKDYLLNNFDLEQHKDKVL